MSDDDGSDGGSHSSANLGAMTDAEVREWHERKCEEGDGWSHGFEFYECERKGEEGCSTIENPRRRVTKLFAQENWRRMGEHLDKHARGYSEIDLSDCGLTTEHAEALFGPGVRANRCPFKYINLSNNPLGPLGIAAFIENASESMVWLNLNNLDFGFDGVRRLSEGLDGDICIEVLWLENTKFGGFGIECLLEAKNSAHLRELRLCHQSLGSPGVRGIATFLGREDTALEKLILQCNYDAPRVILDTIVAQHAKFLYQSMSSNSKLEELSFWDSRQKQYLMPQDALPDLQTLVCDTRNFTSLIQSNHQLKNVAGEWNDPIVSETTKPYSRSRFIYEALIINQRSKHGASAAQIVRAKLRMFYFADHFWNAKDFDVQPFVDLDVALMPQVLELVTRSEASLDREHFFALCTGNVGSIYRLIKNYPTEVLFGFSCQETKMQRLEEENARLRKQVAELAAGCSCVSKKRAKVG